MPPPNPKRPEEFTEDQWEQACARAKKRAGSVWENPPSNPEGWRFSRCYTSALDMFPLPPEPPVGPGFRAARALKKGAEGNPEKGGRRRTRKSRRTRKTRRSRK